MFGATMPLIQRVGQVSRIKLLSVVAVAGVIALAVYGIVGWAEGRNSGFVERAPQVGINFRMNNLPGEQGEKRFRINLYDHGSGLAIGDFDNDGRDDIYFANQYGANALYRNTGDGRFEDVTAKAGVAVGGRVSVAATFADYDNDGNEDLFVTTTRGGNILFHNRGDGTFEDVTEKAGVSHVGHSQTAVFFDYDNDGYLDLLLTNTAQWTTNHFDSAEHSYEGKASLPALMNSPTEYNILYHNNQNGTFVDATARSGLGGRGWAGDAAVFDYNEDGFPDVFLPSMFGRGQLYRNNGDGTFTDVTPHTLGATPRGAIGAKVFDYDGDGRLDLFVVDMHSDMWMALDADQKSRDAALQMQHRRFRSQNGPLADENAPNFVARQRGEFAIHGEDYDSFIFGNALYHNLGGGKFEETAVDAGLETFWPWGIATGDFDNDGNEDVFITSGMGYPFYYWPNQLMMNKGDGTFVDRAEQLGVEPPAGGDFQKKLIAGKKAARSSRSAAVADFDNSGRLEIVTNNFNGRPYFFDNHFAGRNYLELKLTGTRSNRDAIGAVARVYVDRRVLVREVNPAGGYLAQSSRVLHFGLSDHRAIDSVVIRWPSNARQTLTRPHINSRLEVREPQ
jgi:enediyne biosynthesis protein E4